MQVVSVTSGGSVGSLEWAWGLEADVYEVRINVPADLDVRMKIALISLCALCMVSYVTTVTSHPVYSNYFLYWL